MAAASPLTAVSGAYQASLDVPDGGDPLFAISTRDNTPLPPTNRFGVSSVLPGFGIMPKKVFTAEEAREALDRDGAVILAGLETAHEGLEAYMDAAFDLPENVFGDKLLAASPLGLVGVYGKDGAQELKDYYTENWTEKPDEPPADHGATGKGPVWTGIHPWVPNCAHTDSSTIASSAPYFFILFAADCEQGGENAIVDSKFVVEEMARTPALAEHAARLRRVPVDNVGRARGDSERFHRSQHAMGASVNECVSPIVQELEGGRTFIRMLTSQQRPATAEQKLRAKAEDPASRADWDDNEDMEADQRMIDAFKDAVFGATAHAPRFRVGAGEALIFDNYRALHIREPYLDLDRRGWRREVYVDGKCAGQHERTETSVRNELLPTVVNNLELVAAAAAAAASSEGPAAAHTQSKL